MADDDFVSDLGIAGSFDVPAGEQYTSDLLPSFGPREKPEETTVEPTKINPVQAFRERRDQRLLQLRAPPGAPENIAQACWGGQATFPQSSSTPTQAPGFTGGGFNTKDREQSDPPPDEPPVENWQERQRDSTTVEVVSEEDPEVKVEIKVATKSTLKLPSITVSKTTGSGSKAVTTTFTIPERTAEITWLGEDA